MKHFLLYFLLIALYFTGFSQESEKDVVKVFFLGGQSNMVGFGYNNELPDSLKKTFKNVWIFHGNPVGDEQKLGGVGIWEALKPGHGKGFSSDGITNKHSQRFGLELSFAQKIQELYPGEKIALIKYARGGSSIDSLATKTGGTWEPDFNGKTGINQYDHFLTTLNKAFAVDDIDGDGRTDHLVPAGILWMQGENDASRTEEIAQRYSAHLKRLMDLIRAAFRVDDLPIVLGKISDSWQDDEDGRVWNQGELIQFAQEKYARSDGNAAIVRKTRYYKYSDRHHYDTNGYIDFGKEFAIKLFNLIKKNQ